MATKKVTTTPVPTQPSQDSYNRLPDAIEAGFDIMAKAPAALLQNYPELEQRIPYMCDCGSSDRAAAVLYHSFLAHLGERGTFFESPSTIANWLRHELRTAHFRKTGDLRAQLVCISAVAPGKQGVATTTTDLEIPENPSGEYETEIVFRFSIDGSTYAEVRLIPSDVWNLLKKNAEYTDGNGNPLEYTRNLA
jgi:hypothetical protein